MSKRIVLLVASLAVVIGMMNCGSSYAWFVTSAKKSQSISVSAVSSVYSAYLTDLDSEDSILIMQGDNLVSLDGRSAMLQIENKSTTSTQIRISIEYTSYASGAAEQVMYSASEADDIVVTFAERKWSKNINVSNDCYFYYVGDEYTSDEIENLDNLPSIGAETAVIKAISSIVYKNDISNAYSGQKVNIKVTFESKQADNVTWSNIDTYNVAGEKA